MRYGDSGLNFDNSVIVPGRGSVATVETPPHKHEGKFPSVFNRGELESASKPAARAPLFPSSQGRAGADPGDLTMHEIPRTFASFAAP